MPPIVISPIHIGGRISGSGVIDDLCGRIADRLCRNGDLRTVDSYSSYAARIVIELDLQDVDVIKATETITVGVMPAPSVQSVAAQPKAITLEVPSIPASMLALSNDSLERTVAGDLPEPHIVDPQRNLERNADGSELSSPEPPVTHGKKQYNAPKWSAPGSRAARGPDDNDHDDGLVSST